MRDAVKLVEEGTESARYGHTAGSDPEVVVEVEQRPPEGLHHEVADERELNLTSRAREPAGSVEVVQHLVLNPK